MRTVPAMASALWLLTGCATDHEPAAAGAVVQSFQHALQRRDEGACRDLLTRESHAALAELPWDRVQARPPLHVLGARREGHEFRVQVTDPGDGGTAGEFVVVREYGKLVVDLVATAGLRAEVVEASASSGTNGANGSNERLEPRELTPADLDRIRQYELAQPAR